MVRFIKTKRGGAIAKFGNGTVNVKAYPLQSRIGAQLELSRCVATNIGEKSEKIFTREPNIVLDFTSLESLQIVIDKLEDIREMLIDQGVKK